MPAPCSIAETVAVAGARWSLLILRDLLYGRHRFGDIAASTGAPRDILTTRLRELEAAGLVRRERYSERPPRFEYHLTEAGAELAPVLALLAAWGDKWRSPEGVGPPVVFHHRNHVASPRLACATCGQMVHLVDMSAESTTGEWEGLRSLVPAVASTE